MKLRCLLTAFAVIATLSACGGREGPADIRTGDIPAPTDKVDVYAAGPNGFAPFSRWPKACDLFTEADVRAAYPGISKLEQDSIDYKLDVTDGAFGRSARETVVDGTCAYEFWFDGREVDESAAVYSSRLSVTVRLAGDPKTIDRNYKPGEQDSAPDPKVPGADECRTTSDEIECKLPNVSFAVSARIHLLGGIRFDKQPDNQNSSDYVRSELLPAYAAVVADRLT